jgi:hypothetical protein
MTSDIDNAAVAHLQAKFDHFARHAFAEDPLYAALAAAAAAHAGWAALLAAAPATQQLPLLWLAALQDRVLELGDAGQRPPLADYFASVGDARAPDPALLTHLGDFIAANRDALVRRIATRTTQTNEIGRCAVLWPLLQDLAETSGRRPLALLDVGCSAGLNLGVDHWRYRYIDDDTGATIATTPPDRDPAAPEIACRVLAGARPSAVAEPEIVSRSGVDVSPIFVGDAAEVRWLRACLWPHDAERRARFDAAVAIARTQRWPLGTTSDAAASVEAWLRDVPDDVTPVVFNSWVLRYFDELLLRRHVDAMLGAVARRGAVWINAEDPTLSRAWWPGKPESAADALPNATSWTVARPDGHGGVAWALAATSHAHGRWMLYEGWAKSAGR